MRVYYVKITLILFNSRAHWVLLNQEPRRGHSGNSVGYYTHENSGRLVAGLSGRISGAGLASPFFSLAAYGR